MTMTRVNQSSHFYRGVPACPWTGNDLRHVAVKRVI